MTTGRGLREEIQEQTLTTLSLRALAAKLARTTGATVVGLSAAWAGSSTSARSTTSDVGAAELVAARFVSGFEAFSYQDPTEKPAVADLATPGLAALLVSPSQAAAGPALVAEKFTATATVVGFEVESDTGAAVQLLADTAIRLSTVSGSHLATRLVPVSLIEGAGGWKVNGVDGLTAASAGRPSSPPPVVPSTVAPAPDGSTTTTTTAGAGPPGPGAPEPGVTGAVGDVPAAYVALMKAAVAAVCPSLSWTVLAGIGKVESDFGKSTLPGVHSGANPMGAEGPMQFEPATFAAYGTVAPGGADPASPYDPADAIYSAAHLLCADGAGNPARLYAALFDYNHSDAYVSLVLAYANEYAQIAALGGPPGQVEQGLGSVIVADAESYLGTKYVWGGESPGIGFDCSGLVQWVYAEAGISLPRVAQEQYNHGPHLLAAAPLYPGDLVFFGGGPSAVDHVGIYVGNGDMIDAPYTGAVVRFDRVAGVPLGFVGATRPEIPDMSVGAGVPVIATTYPTGAGSGSGAGHGAGGHPAGGSGSSGGTHHGGGSSTGRHHPTTTTTAPDTTTTSRPGRHHGTTTTTTAPDTTTSTTDPGVTTTTTSKPPRHPTTTTTTSTTTTTTAPSASPSTTMGTGATSTTVAAAPDSAPATTTPTPRPPGRHHR